jgi:hypothetical protein
MLFLMLCAVGLKRYDELARNVWLVAKGVLPAFVNDRLDLPMLKLAMPSKSTLFRQP